MTPDPLLAAAFPGLVRRLLGVRGALDDVAWHGLSLDVPPGSPLTLLPREVLHRRLCPG